MFGPNCLTTFGWFRQFNAPRPPSVLSADAADPTTAFTGALALHITSGGYVQSLAGGIYCFPIECIDLATGIAHTATLRVPFDGTLSLPETNYSGNKESMHAYGAYKLGITRIKVDNNRLEVWLVTEKASVVAIFDIGDLVTLK